jgi:hypothetical protein
MVAAFGASFYTSYGRPPCRQEIIEAYYGEYVEPVDLFIGFDRPAAFDMPLVATGTEDLYFTVSPSPYLAPEALRAVLYDHLFSRRVVDDDYGALSPEAREALSSFYQLNRQAVLGVGRRHSSGRFWYPLPQVHLPHELASEVKPPIQSGIIR